jgi:hypothetical protein
MATTKHVDDLAAVARAYLAWNHPDPNAHAVLRSIGLQLAADRIRRLEEIAAGKAGTEDGMASAAHLAELRRTASFPHPL